MFSLKSFYPFKKITPYSYLSFPRLPHVISIVVKESSQGWATDTLSTKPIPVTVIFFLPDPFYF